jgi:hypothetical protein
MQTEATEGMLDKLIQKKMEDVRLLILELGGQKAMITFMKQYF